MNKEALYTATLNRTASNGYIKYPSDGTGRDNYIAF